MKHLFVCLLLLLPSLGYAQCQEFDRLIKKGDDYLRGAKPNYQEAINAYTVALLACATRASEAKDRIAKMVAAINQLREDAEKAKNTTQIALQETEKQKAKNQKLVDAFYFAYDRFAFSVLSVPRTDSLVSQNQTSSGANVKWF